MKYFLKHLPFSILLISLMLSGNTLRSQTVENVAKDTIKKEIVSIDATQFPDKSAKTFNLIQDINNKVASTEEIQKWTEKNEVILNEIDSLFVEDDDIDYDNQTTRYLSNRIIFWKSYLKDIESGTTFLTQKIDVIDKYNQRVSNELKVYKLTKNDISTDDPESGILPRIDFIVHSLDSVSKSLNKKFNSILILLNKYTETGLSLDNRINKIVDIYDGKRKLIFVQNEPSIFSVEYRNRSKTSFTNPLIKFYHNEVEPSLEYLNERIFRLVLNMLLLLVLIVGLRILSRKLKDVDYNYSSFYRKYMVMILSRSISASIVLAVFSTILFFDNRPEFIKDLLNIILIIPLIRIIQTFLNRRFHKYLILYAIAIFINTVYIIFPPDNMYYMILMLVTALIEIFTLWRLYKYLLNNPLKHKFANFLIIVVVLIMLGFSLSGAAGLLYGSTTLAELTLNVPLYTTYSGSLILIAVIIINGIISFLLETKRANRLNFVYYHGHVIKKRIIGIITFLFAFLWIQSILNLLNIYKPIVESVTSFLQYNIVIGTIEFRVGDVFLFFIVIYVSILLSNMIKILLEKDILNKIQLEKGLPHTIAMMAKYSIITFGVIIAISAVGIPMSNLAVIAGAMGVGIGFGLQSIFNNIVSGFILLFERPIQIGDTIEVGSLLGTVKSIGVRASKIKTFDGADIIVPNGDIVSNQVVNWTLSDQKRRVEVLAGVAYGSDPHKVKKLFEEVLANHKDIINDPEPIVYFQGLGDSSLDFRILFWTSSFDHWLQLRSEIVFGVHDILYREGISIPFPQMDLHLKSVETPIEVAQKGGNISSTKKK
jgi:small-conductance mechanosensitive channel